MEHEFMALNFVKNNPFFKKDAEKRMSASFCGSMSLVDETVVVSEPIRRPFARGFRGLVSSSRSKSAFSLADNQGQPDTMVVEGTTVRLRRTDSTRRKEMAARRETVEILMEEIVRENRKSTAEIEAEERAASSGSDLEYGPGIVERLKAKFGRISTGDKRRKNHKRHHSVDDILEESEYGTYDRRQSRQLTIPERSTQTLDRSPRHSSAGSDQLTRRASRSMADLSADEYGDRRAFSLQRPSRREEYEREQEERLAHRLSLEDDDMVDIRELRKMFDRPAEGTTAPAPWRSEARRERFIERGRTHQTVPPNLGDSRRDAPPPRELRLSAPAAPMCMDQGAEEEYATAARAVPLKKTTLRRDREERPVFDEEVKPEPEFVAMARRLRRATVDLTEEKQEETATTRQPLAIVTTAPADPAPASDTHQLISPPAGRRDSFTGAASDVSPPPEEPKPPMRPSPQMDLTTALTSSLHSDCDSRYSSLARSERSERSERSTSTHVPYSDLSLPRSDYSTASKTSKRSVSTDGGVRMGYCRSTSSDRRSSAIKKLVPENQEASGVEEMQRLLNKFSARKPREEEKEAPPADAQLLAAREAREENEEERSRRSSNRDLQPLQQPQKPPRMTAVLSPEPERRRFVPTVVGIRSSDGRQLLSPTTVAPPSIAAELLQAAAPAANVVSISVRDSAPSVIYTNHRSGSYDLQQAQQCQFAIGCEQGYGRISSLADTVEGRTSSRVALPYAAVPYPMVPYARVPYTIRRVERVESAAHPVPAPRKNTGIKRRLTSGPRMGLSAL